MQQLLLDILPKSAPTLDNFVVGSNLVAFNAVDTLKPGQAIYLWGNPGCGRSHLLKAKTSAPNCIYLDKNSELMQFENILNDGLAINTIAVDDLNQLDDQQQAVLFTIFNVWRSNIDTKNAFAIICAGDYAPLNMPLREDLRTRIGWDLVYRLDLLSDEQRALALQDKANDLGIELSKDVLNWVLTHYERDMRSLTALLKALDSYSLAQHRAITIPLLKDVLAKTNKT